MDCWGVCPEGKGPHLFVVATVDDFSLLRCLEAHGFAMTLWSLCLRWVSLFPADINDQASFTTAV